MAHMKRQKMPKNWPVKRKGTKFVVKPLSKKGIPCLIVLRDMLKIAKTRKEVKRTIHKKQLLINNLTIKDEKIGLTLFDVLTIISAKKHYRLNLSENGKFILEEIKPTEANTKIIKITGKKILKGKKVQLNLLDGSNILSNLKCQVGDSILMNFKDKKIEKCLSIKERSEVIIFAGKHSGKKGKIEKINKNKKIVLVKSQDKKFNTLIKQIMVIK